MLFNVLMFAAKNVPMRNVLTMENVDKKKSIFCLSWERCWLMFVAILKLYISLNLFRNVKHNTCEVIKINHPFKNLYIVAKW